jgi:hypothetical protein
MKKLTVIVITLLIATTGRINAQIAFSSFMEGTWKYEYRDSYEHRDSGDDGSMMGYSYKIVTDEYNLLQDFFRNITGTWTAWPADSSFISQLEYKKGKEQFFLAAGNTVFSKTGDIYAKYEGVYIYNPVENHITFITITKSEIHTGACHVEGDTLFHHAHISGSGRIKSYSSAIVKMQDGTLHYYADYSESETFPEISYRRPLVYRRQNP